MVAEGVVADRAAVSSEHWSSKRSKRTRTQIHTMQVVIKQVAADQGSAARALTDVVIAVNENPVAALVVDDVVVGNEQAGKRLRPVAKDGLTTAGDVRSVHHILVNRDVRTAAIHKHRRLRVATEAVIADLEITEVAA